MNTGRRVLLKGMALSSIAGLTMGHSMSSRATGAAAPVGRPLLALVNEGEGGSVFLHGAAAACPSALQAKRVGRDLNFMLDLERRLRNNPAMRVIGLLDDASATLVVDLARSAGARIQWLGHHTDEARYTRHHLLNTDIAEGCSGPLSRQLLACGAGFQITEERQGSRAIPRRLCAAARDSKRRAEWASAVGYLLASRGAPPATAPPASYGDIVLSGSFVSFSIEA